MAVPRRLIVVAASAIVAGVALYVRNRMKEREGKEGGDAAPVPHAQNSNGAKGQGEKGDAPHSATGAEVPAGSLRELSQFLAGESWFDEVGWQGIWEREGIDSPEGWLKSKGKDVLATERTKLVDHPALLAGCRRRWIVVCRYAGIDVADAAQLWTATETAAA